MAARIRLRQQGRKNRPFYRLVLTDSKNPRDGRYVETLGWYNPFEEELENNLSVKTERVEYWLSQGAILSEKAEALVAKVAPSVVKSIKEKAIAKKAKSRSKKKAKVKA